MGSDDPRRLFCGHCGITVDMRRLSVATYDVRDEGIWWWTYRVYQCPSCKGVTFLLDHTSTEYDRGDGELETETTILYPTESDVGAYVPPPVWCEIESARKVKRTDSNAFAVLARRALEAVCADFSAEGSTLYEQLQNIAERGLIPSNLVEATRQIRVVGNVGAHSSLGSVSVSDVETLDALLTTVLEYLYKAPALVAILNKSLERSS